MNCKKCDQRVPDDHLNNPLKYTDPDGEVWWIPLLANICMNAAISRANGDGLANGAMKGLAYSAISMAGSYASNFIGNLFGHQLGNLGTELLRSGAHGLIQGTVNELTGGNFLNGFAAASLSSLTGSGLKAMGASSDLTLLGMGTVGAFASQFSGGNYFDGFMTGINIGVFNHEWEILEDGTLHCILDEVVVTGTNKSRIASLSYIATMSGMKSVGYLTAYNSNDKVMFKTRAISGSPTKYRTLPPGDYQATKFYDSSNPAFMRKEVGFKVILTDMYDPHLQRTRSLLRIHPARGSSTMGCIGLISNDTDSLHMFVIKENRPR